MSDQAAQSKSRWAQGWPDGLAFALGLAIAWFAKWETTDLVWSLWLSSLAVGYATIVWTIVRAMRTYLRGSAIDDLTGPTANRAAGSGMVYGGALFMLAFFTVHFCGFHYGHSTFLNVFFPVEDGVKGFPTWGTFGLVLKRYWIFLPVAFLAERAAFRKPQKKVEEGSVTVEAIAKRKAAPMNEGDLMAPYKNVMRMHILIFFFAGASFAKLDSFLVYAVVYAVYFFPWKLLKNSRVA